MHFKRFIPLEALGFLAIALGSLGITAGYTLYLNPEIRLYRSVAQIKEDWVTRLNQTSGPKYVFAGGSSCATGVRPQQLLRNYGLKAANLGLNAGMGAELLANYGLEQTRGGDTFVLAMEPDLLTGDTTIPSTGRQFALATGHAELLEPNTVTAKLSSLLSLRPGGYHFFTLLGKLISHQPLYRYAVSDFDVSGYQRVTERRSFDPSPLEPIHLSSGARLLLNRLSSHCRDSNYGLVYTLPWTYVPTERAHAAKRINLDFLIDVAEFMPVLPDSQFGVWSERSEFADTFRHLTEKGAIRRTDSLGRALKQPFRWSRAGLKRMRDPLP